MQKSYTAKIMPHIPHAGNLIAMQIGCQKHVCIGKCSRSAQKYLTYFTDIGHKIWKF